MQESIFTPVTSLVDLGRAFWVAFLASAVFAYPIWRLLIKLKSRQTVSQYAPDTHQVKQGTPTMGGLIIAIGVLAAYGYEAYRFAIGASDLPGPMNLGANTGPNFPLAALFLFAGFLLIGFIDDFLVPRLIAGKRGLGWKQKIVMQLVVATVAPLLITGWSWKPWVPVCVFLILFFSNAYNFSDGLDALAGTLLLGLTAGFGALAWHSGNGQMALLVVPLFAAAIPFLYINVPPARVFMGDVGSLPIGAVLGFVACLLIYAPTQVKYGLYPYPNIDAVWPQAGQPNPAIGLAMAVAIFIASLVMVAELVPVPLQILSVKLFKRKLFPYTPIHHAFEKAGWKETRVVGMFALTQLVLSLLALTAFLQMTPPQEPPSTVVKSGR